MAKRNKRKRNFVWTFVIAICLLFFSFILFSYYLLNKKIDANEIYVEVYSNNSIYKIVEYFNFNGLLKPKEFFIPFLRLYRIVTNEIPVSGTYRFTNQNSNFDIIRSIFSGKNLSIVKVTYPEGITVRDFALITQRKLDIDTTEFYDAITKGNYISKLNIPINSIEGYLMPETYFFYTQTNPQVVVRKLIETQNKIWEQKFERICKEKGLSRHFVLTLASLIELESPLKEERKRISGVFYNRLRKGMRLESDPTVQFALSTKKRLDIKDLDVSHPYNTYKIKGLPPGPLCSPSVTSIEAAIYPEEHNYLYFVSYGDGSGRHRFATTFKEHLINKKLFKKALKEKNSASK
ncbi:MAG: endolytic transglycosylase MltG [Ignavibacteria bacterium]|nr:endolytic transglycosylase MltG [Ignavibacteria bacterium]